VKKGQARFGAQMLLAVAFPVIVSSVGSAADAIAAAPVSGGVVCVGDCNGDGGVTVDEIITGVNIALGSVEANACPSYEINGPVTVGGILTAVNEALNGCPAGAPGTVSGTAVKGPVSNATVRAFVIGPNGTLGAQMGSGMTDDAGNFTMQVGNYSGPLMLEMMGGSFMDEATGAHVEMGVTDMMTTAIPNMPADAGLSGVEITPLTSMAQQMAQHMSGGMTQANIMQANSAVGSYFDISDIMTVHPMDPTASGAGGFANRDERNYGMVMAAMSEYADMVGMSSPSGIITAMMDDASDGVMNGMMGGTRINMGGMGGMMGGSMMQSDAGTSGLGSAMTSFMLSAQNKSGLTMQDMQSLIDKLNAANGVIQ
jgi:hypothetical protein